MSEELHVVIEGEGDDDAPASSGSTQRTRELNEQADRDAAYAARTARVRFETARRDHENRLNMFANDWATAKAEGDAAEAELAAAADLGDFRAQAAANRKLSAATARMEMSARRHEQEQQTRVRTGDDFGDHTAQHTESTAEWMHGHREWITDPRKYAKVQGAHYDALAEGIDVDSPEYFSHVERKIGMKPTGNGNGSSNRGGNVQRGSSNYDPNDVNTHVQEGGVFLSKGERERANDGSIVWNTGPKRGQPIGNSEYARRKQAMIAEGRYHKLG
jgi:hypothetical protein